jgi:hypothetical protein
MLARTLQESVDGSLFVAFPDTVLFCETLGYTRIFRVTQVIGSLLATTYTHKKTKLYHT